MKRGLFVIVFAMISLIGCANTNLEDESQDRNQHDQNVDPINFETNRETRERQGWNDNPEKEYLQSNEEGIGRGGVEHNIFKTDEAREIAQQLSLRDDVKQTQVATTEDQVAVFVLLRDYQDPDIAKSLEDEIENISPNKEILIYTDKVHWNRLKDLEGSMGARKIGNDLEKFLEENLNIEIRD